MATCPTCERPLPANGKHVPFCSSRCKLVDLGHWLDGDYVVAGDGAIDTGLEAFGLKTEDGDGPDDR